MTRSRDMASSRERCADRRHRWIHQLHAYTHRMSLAHAEVNMSRLLDRVIDAAPEFDLIEIEGEAAFMARPAGPGGDRTYARVLRGRS